MGEPPPLALVDCNNFYVSCERAFDRKLEGVPVLVLSNNDGCAIARSEDVPVHSFEAPICAYAAISIGPIRSSRT